MTAPNDDVDNGRLQQTGTGDDALQDIRREQLKALYHKGVNLFPINLFAALLVAAVLWPVAPRTPLIAWLACAFLLALAADLMRWHYHRPATDRGRIDTWLRRSVVNHALYGLFWGACVVVLYVDGRVEYQLFLIIVVSGMSLGTLVNHVLYLPAFYAYFLPIAVAAVLRMAWGGDALHIAIAILIAAFTVLMVSYARRLNASLIETLLLRSANLDLVERLRKRNAQVEQANTAKSKFLAAASHDLRQPMHALVLFLGALRQQLKQPEVQPLLTNIDHSLGTLEQLLDSLLDISKIDAGAIVPKPAPLQLSTLLAKLDAEFQPQAHAKGLQWACDCPAILVHTDAGLFERILRNLISNAIRYTPAGQVAVRVIPNATAARIVVEDSGIGIPPDQQQAVFEEFVQLHNPERDRTHGLGLGLAIAQRLADLLHADLELESSLGQGSAFALTLPLAPAAVTTAPAARQPAPSDLRHVRALVIDDEEPVRAGMQALLSQWGCQVLTAGSVPEVIALQAPAWAPNVIIADYRLRDEVSGIDAIHQLNGHFGTQAPGIIITGDTRPERLRQAQASGYELLHKPVKPARLRALLAHTVQRAAP